MYLRDYHAWKYGSFKDGRIGFMDLNRFMMIERKEDMFCKTFNTGKKEGKDGKSTKDAEYITIPILEFLDHSNIEDGNLFCQYNIKAYWNFSFIKLALKVIRNAVIIIPTKEVFPLIVLNDKYHFYIAGGFEEHIKEKEENYYGD